MSGRAEIPQQPTTSVTIFHSELEKQAGLVAGRLAGATTDGVVSIATDLFGGLIGDRIRQWRTRNLVNSLAKTADMLKEKGIPLDKAKVLPMGEAYAMFENASKQDDPTVSELWAGLLANAMDPDSETTIEPALVETLKSFSGCEAALMEFLWRRNLLDEERKASMPPYPVVRSDDDEIYQEELKLTREIAGRAGAKFDENTKKTFDKLLGGKSSGEIRNAISNLTNLRCILVPLRHVYKGELIQTAYVDGHRVEAVHADKLVRVMESLTLALEHTMGAAKRGERAIDPVYPPYALTEHGIRLMEACH